MIAYYCRLSLRGGGFGVGSLGASAVKGWPGHISESLAGEGKAKAGLRRDLETLKWGVKSRNVAENKGLACKSTEYKPDMFMKIKDITGQSRNVVENKSS